MLITITQDIIDQDKKNYTNPNLRRSCSCALALGMKSAGYVYPRVGFRVAYYTQAGHMVPTEMNLSEEAIQFVKSADQGTAVPCSFELERK